MYAPLGMRKLTRLLLLRLVSGTEIFGQKAADRAALEAVHAQGVSL